MAIVLNGSLGIQNPLGSAAAPSESNTTNSNTGAYFPTGTTYGIATNGTNAMYIDASQNVGIGTTSPGSYGKLTVVTDGTTISAVASGNNTSTSVQIRNLDSAGNVLFGTYSYGPSYSGGSLFSVGANGTALTSLASAPLAVGTYTANPLIFGTNTSERMRIDSSGNVGIGTSSPSYKLEVQGSANTYLGQRIYNTNAGSSAVSYLQIGNDTNGAAAQLGLNSSTNTTNFGGANGLYLANGLSAAIAFATGGFERMRIDSSGNLLVGTTSQIGTAKINFAFDGSSVNGMTIKNSTSAGTPNAVVFQWGTTTVGTIGFNASSTSYNTSSDYRLKENVQPMTTGLAIIGALKPVTYKWNFDNSKGEGFIAHELQSVIPLAVTGEKDAVNEDGSIKPQGVDYSKIVVHLVAAIQELTSEVTALKAKVGA